MLTKIKYIWENKMNINKVKITNFRKFNNNDNEVIFNKLYRNSNQFSKSASLIVGQNNAGKTSLIKAIEAAVTKPELTIDDVNYDHIEEIRSSWDGKKPVNLFITLKFYVELGDVDLDMLTNLYEFVSISDVINTNQNIEIIVKFESENLNELDIQDEDLSDFYSFYKKLEGVTLKKKYYNSEDQLVTNFKLSNLIDIKTIKANKLDKDQKLSESFTKIIKYVIENDNELKDKTILAIDIFNQSMGTDLLSSSKKLEIDTAALLTTYNVGIALESNLQLKNVLSTQIKYSFKEEAYNIPETQFGLGYSNLVQIIAELVDYIQKFDDETTNNKISLLAIEEPETYMHPQMQSNFIGNIDLAIQKILKNHNKDHLNVQTLITTHSNNILTSKLHANNCFDNIIYFDKKGVIKNLSDEMLNISENDRFIKKHVRLETSNIFFADAVILVEGITEKIYLKEILENDNRFISKIVEVYIVNGTHANKYNDLIKSLEIPTLIITDLDIKVTTKTKAKNCNDITSFKTTNPMFKDESSLLKISETLTKLNNEIGNRIVTTQHEKINGYYATSFEEAFILTNYQNQTLKSILNKIFPKAKEDYLNDMKKNQDIGKIN